MHVSHFELRESTGHTLDVCVLVCEGSKDFHFMLTTTPLLSDTFANKQTPSPQATLGFSYNSSEREREKKRKSNMSEENTPTVAMTMLPRMISLCGFCAKL